MKISQFIMLIAISSVCLTNREARCDEMCHDIPYKEGKQSCLNQCKIRKCFEKCSSLNPYSVIRDNCESSCRALPKVSEPIDEVDSFDPKRKAFCLKKCAHFETGSERRKMCIRGCMSRYKTKTVTADKRKAYCLKKCAH